MDATSDDGRHALTAIAFIGSVFSPHYARAHAKNLGDPYNHVAINLALYGQPRSWVFTEAGPAHSTIQADGVRVGRNTWRRTADGVELTIDDRSTPWGRRVRGRITLTSGAPATEQSHALHPNGAHHWWPVMPVARIDVAMEAPKLAWQGHAYHDCNWGDEPLAAGFSAWSWMRATEPSGTRIHYSATTCKRPQHAAAQVDVSIHIAPDGSVKPVPMPERQKMPRSRWGIVGTIHGRIKRVQALEDTPFYTRSRVWLQGQAPHSEVVHEALDMTRWQQDWVKFLLPFRLRRAKNAGRA